MPRYEVWCPSCDVSFPVGTKRCLHCGNRTVSDRPARAKRASQRPEAAERPVRVYGSDETQIEIADAEALEEMEGESASRRGLRAGMSIVWMVLLAAGYIWQNCTGGPA